MNDSAIQIVKHLGSNEVYVLAEKITRQSKTKENAVILLNLLDGLDSQRKGDFYSYILSTCQNLFYKDKFDITESDDIGIVAGYCQKLPQLYNELLLGANVRLSSFIKVLPELKTVFESFDVKNTSNPHDEVATEHVLSILESLNYLFVNTNQKQNSLDIAILLLTGALDSAISSKATQLIRWRIKNLNENPAFSYMLWEIVFALTNSSETHKGNGFIIWIRHLNEQISRKSDALQDVFSRESYWSKLQEGLSSDSQEICKFNLAILKLTIKSIDFDIRSKIFVWSNDKKKRLITEWERYITLYEILRIDTSLHQAEAGSHTIASFTSSESPIHPSWGFCLLSTGFHATMDSVRKFSLSLLLNLPQENLGSFVHGSIYLEDVFLPYAMLASHFVVKNIHGRPVCPYGNRLAQFISSILNEAESENALARIIYSVLKVLKNHKESFDPARLYVGYGIVEALRNREVLNFGYHDSLLLELFASTSEGSVFETISQTINLKLLIGFKFDGIKNFLNMLEKFISFNGHTILKAHLISISEYLRRNGIEREALNTYLKVIDSVASKAILIGLLDGNPSELIGEDIELVCKVLEFNLQERTSWHEELSTLFNWIIEDIFKMKSTDKAIYVCLSKIDMSDVKFEVSPSINYDAFWGSISNDVGSLSVERVEIAFYKLELLTNILSVSGGFLRFADIIEVIETFLDVSSKMMKTVKYMYKLREKILGNFYKLLCITTRSSRIDEKLVLNTFDVVDNGISDFNANMHLVDLCQILLEKSDSQFALSKILQFGVELWENLVASRLQLNQKKLHISLIDLVVSTKFLKLSSEAKIDNALLSGFCNSVIESSVGRRSLLPRLVENLSKFQLLDSTAFESLDWVPDILLNASLVYQLRSNAFKLEVTMAELYDQRLSDFGGNLYLESYGAEEISASINTTAMLASLKSRDSYFRIFKLIVDNPDRFPIFKVLRSVDGLEEWKRIKLFSILLVITLHLNTNDIKKFLDSTICALGSEPSPLVRVFMEWILALHLNESYFQTLFEELENPKSPLKPTVMASYQRILFLKISKLSKGTKRDMMTRFLRILIPAATSNKALTRHFSLSLVCSVYREAEIEELKLDKNLTDIITNMYKSASSSEASEQYRSGDALTWDIQKDITLVSITGGILLRVSDRSDFDYISKEKFKENLSEKQIAFLNIEIGDDNMQKWVITRKEQKNPVALNKTSPQTPLQTKSGAWNSFLNFEEERITDINRSDLIVLASLVGKAPNLGGICRLCDVLGAGQLAINDIKVKEHPQFKNVAVTADQWMPMVEVPIDKMVNFLKVKKKEGYTLLGLEQTDQSVQLNNDFKFPKKSVIVLGAEKEGINGDVLAELDVCIEIKQVGVIRSMNIQTATAVIVHGYSTQHC